MVGGPTIERAAFGDPLSDEILTVVRQTLNSHFVTPRAHGDAVSYTGHAGPRIARRFSFQLVSMRSR
jgi:hypothetical protein